MCSVEQAFLPGIDSKGDRVLKRANPTTFFVVVTRYSAEPGAVLHTQQKIFHRTWIALKEEWWY